MSTTQEVLHGTASESSTIRSYGNVSFTSALSVRADWLRTDAEQFVRDVRVVHEKTRSADLQERAFEKATRKDVIGLLDELAYERGLGWSDIASLAGVSVSAVRKWRKGGDATAPSRQSLAEVAAFLDLLESKAGVPDPAAWMEMTLPLGPGYSIRPIDLYLVGQAEVLLDIAELREDASRTLDSAIPGWRTDFASDFEVFTDEDGHRSIRMRDTGA